MEYSMLHSLLIFTIGMALTGIAALAGGPFAALGMGVCSILVLKEII